MAALTPLTGTTYHVHSAFIPTIERVKLDFEDKVLGHWNRELLSFAGALARCAYDHEIVEAVGAPSPPLNTTSAKVSSKSNKAVTSSRSKKGAPNGADAGAAAPITLASPPPDRWILSLLGLANLLPTTRATRVNENLIQHGFLRKGTPLTIPVLLPVTDLSPSVVDVVADDGAEDEEDSLLLMDSDEEWDDYGAMTTATKGTAKAKAVPRMQKKAKGRSTSSPRAMGFSLSLWSYVPCHGMEAHVQVPSVHPLVLERFAELWNHLVKEGLLLEMTIHVMESCLVKMVLEPSPTATVLQWWCQHCSSKEVFPGGARQAKDLLASVFYKHDDNVVCSICSCQIIDMKHLVEQMRAPGLHGERVV